ncbi:hypothetical protein FB45DRAFT_945311 [Roridomyces roridus]|uniref:Uncharacterized protein n=1 Tax=Roridomyces roridus TaxID=1738132 RepID=A0AAD7FBH9_9AGAR|nr:hypothetical protein FB45DRAFT_945311 [Roridomyces roridus]
MDRHHGRSLVAHRIIVLTQYTLALCLIAGACLVRSELQGQTLVYSGLGLFATGFLALYLSALLDTTSECLEPGTLIAILLIFGNTKNQAPSVRSPWIEPLKYHYIIVPIFTLVFIAVWNSILPTIGLEYRQWDHGFISWVLEILLVVPEALSGFLRRHLAGLRSEIKASEARKTRRMPKEPATRSTETEVGR